MLTCQDGKRMHTLTSCHGERVHTLSVGLKHNKDESNDHDDGDHG